MNPYTAIYDPTYKKYVQLNTVEAREILSKYVKTYLRLHWDQTGGSAEFFYLFDNDQQKQKTLFEIWTQHTSSESNSKKSSFMKKNKYGVYETPNYAFVKRFKQQSKNSKIVTALKTIPNVIIQVGRPYTPSLFSAFEFVTYEKLPLLCVIDEKYSDKMEQFEFETNFKSKISIKFKLFADDHCGIKKMKFKKIGPKCTNDNFVLLIRKVKAEKLLKSREFEVFKNKDNQKYTGENINEIIDKEIKDIDEKMTDNTTYQKSFQLQSNFWYEESVKIYCEPPPLECVIDTQYRKLGQSYNGKTVKDFCTAITDHQSGFKKTFFTSNQCGIRSFEAVNIVDGAFCFQEDLYSQKKQLQKITNKIINLQLELLEVPAYSEKTSKIAYELVELGKTKKQLEGLVSEEENMKQQFTVYVLLVRKVKSNMDTGNIKYGELDYNAQRINNIIDERLECESKHHTERIYTDNTWYEDTVMFCCDETFTI